MREGLERMLPPPESGFNKTVISEFLDKKYPKDNEMLRPLRTKFETALETNDLAVLKKLAESIENYCDYHLQKDRDNKETRAFVERLMAEKAKISSLIEAAE